MFSTLVQPRAALIFLSAGLLAYVVYELLFMAKSLARLKLLAIFADFFAVAFACGLYIFLTHAVNFGQIQAYTIICFIAGFFIMRFALKNSLRKIFDWFNEKVTLVIERKKEERRVSREKKRALRQAKRLKRKEKREAKRLENEVKRHAKYVRLCELNAKKEAKRNADEEKKRIAKIVKAHKKTAAGAKTLSFKTFKNVQKS